MTQVNLLPADLRERQKVRRLTAMVITGVTAAVALLFFVFVLQASRLSEAKTDLATQEGVNADLQAQINELQEFADLRVEVEAREGLSATALSAHVLWSGVLRDVSMVIPGEMWLTSMTGSVADTTGLAPIPTVPTTPTPTASASPGETTTPPAVTTPGTLVPGPVTIVGSIQFQGYATDHPTVARWLTRLEKVDGWVNSWLTNSTEADFNGEAKVQWTGSVDLTLEATVQGRTVQ